MGYIAAFFAGAAVMVLCVFALAYAARASGRVTNRHVMVRERGARSFGKSATGPNSRAPIKETVVVVKGH